MASHDCASLAVYSRKLDSLVGVWRCRCGQVFYRSFRVWPKPR